MMCYHYKVLSCSSTESLEEELNKFSKEGYTSLGNFQVTLNKAGYPRYSIVMGKFIDSDLLELNQLETNND